ILFFSDNGGCAEELAPGQSIGTQACPPVTRSGEPVVVGNDPDHLPGPPTTYQSYGAEWATVSNTPFRLWKRWVHEGGISTPFIASWPGGGVGRGGTISHAVGHVIDIVPTVMDAVGLPVELEGVSLLPRWRDPADVGEERAVCWEHMGNAAVRRGRWKLVREWGGAWELYDIVADRIESVGLAGAERDLVAELSAEYERWAKSHGVIPWADVLADRAARSAAAASVRG
ncbi:MAG TPA: sulfatase/phosphatase domain-containing protein, partial [Agromyces sp.]